MGENPFSVFSLIRQGSGIRIVYNGGCTVDQLFHRLSQSGCRFNGDIAFHFAPILMLRFRHRNVK